MEVKINKEIRDFNENIFFGLSLRQFICSVLACVIAIIVYFLFKDILGTEITSWICILCASPFAFLGFVKYNRMIAEQFAIAFIKSNILSCRKLVFKSINYYELITIKNKEVKNENKKII